MICHICPRKCNIDREKTIGFCGEKEKMRVARAALHFYEEPFLSGKAGSGAIFFTGCNLKCVYCQNGVLSRNEVGKEISGQRLYELLHEFKEQGAENINLVTGTHFTEEIIPVLKRVKEENFELPFIWNSGGYESVETIRKLNGLIDIYLPDLKSLSPEVAKKYMYALDYPETAKLAIQEMFRQTGAPFFDSRGMLLRGTVVRHLLLPGGLHDAKKVLHYLSDTYGDRILISLMNQYTPMKECRAPELQNPVSRRTYELLLKEAEKLPLKNIYIQDGKTASESFIPSFDLTGL